MDWSLELEVERHYFRTLDWKKFEEVAIFKISLLLV